MADEATERTEQPTPRRLEEARQSGRIPRSTDLTAAVALLGGLLLLKALGPGLGGELLELVRMVGDASDVRAAGLSDWTTRLIWRCGLAVGPFLLLLVVTAVAGCVVQSGVPLAWKRLVPKLNHLNPLNGLRRLWSLQSLTRLAMSVLKMVLIAAVAYFTIAGDVRAMLAAGALEPAGVLRAGGELVLKLALRVALLLLALALLDYGYQRWEWWRNLKMTRQEVRDELKNMEGDPQMRARRRRVQSQLALQRLRVDVPRADVVVTNPSEYAVALQYDEATMRAPRVVAKGADWMALRIRQIAQECRIPVVQRPPLARALYAAVEVGREIPPTFYRAVAEVLAYVYQLSGRVRRSA